MSYSTRVEDPIAFAERHNAQLVAAMIERACVKLRTTSTTVALRAILSQFVDETVVQSSQPACTHIH